MMKNSFVKKINTYQLQSQVHVLIFFLQLFSHPIGFLPKNTRNEKKMQEKINKKEQKRERERERDTSISG